MHVKMAGLDFLVRSFKRRLVDSGTYQSQSNLKSKIKEGGSL